jgi:hypothetical protein
LAILKDKSSMCLLSNSEKKSSIKSIGFLFVFSFIKSSSRSFNQIITDFISHLDANSINDFLSTIISKSSI